MGMLMAVMTATNSAMLRTPAMGEVNRGVGCGQRALPPQPAPVAVNADGNQDQPQGKDRGQNHENHDPRVRVGLSKPKISRINAKISVMPLVVAKTTPVRLIRF